MLIQLILAIATPILTPCNRTLKLPPTLLMLLGVAFHVLAATECLIAIRTRHTRVRSLVHNCSGGEAVAVGKSVRFVHGRG